MKWRDCYNWDGIYTDSFMIFDANPNFPKIASSSNCLNIGSNLTIQIIPQLLSIERNIATGETSQVITLRHFSSLLFTSLYILTSLALINWKATTIHIHISNISLNFSSLLSEKFSHSLLLSMERRKQYKYINKATQKVQSSSYIFITHPDKFEILWNQIINFFFSPLDGATNLAILIINKI